MIFVARAYCCAKSFGIFSLDGELKEKVLACLDMIESRLPDLAAAKKRKKSLEVVPDPLPPTPVDEATPTLPKKRRGRPPKHPRQDSIESPETGAPKSSQVIAHPNEIVANAVASTAASRGRRNRNGKKSSLLSLVAQFEQQYQDMGEKYHQMGEILAELKAKIEENRESTEQEIRSELLQEVQKTIMSSFPKK